MPSNELWWAQNFQYLNDSERQIALDHYRAAGESDADVIKSMARIGSGIIPSRTDARKLPGEVDRLRNSIQRELLLKATIVEYGEKTSQGQLIQAVTIPWFAIIREIRHDTDFLHKIPWRKLEELIAGAYEEAGWPEVELTPRSGDKGRDIIATKPGICSIRIFDQVKSFKMNHRVTAEDVRAMLGILAFQPNVSKGVITTTSVFAPGIYQEANEFIPYRLELRDGATLKKWLIAVASGKCDLIEADESENKDVERTDG